MRYAKGSIKLSSAQDYPLLRQVMRSQFVTHDQLCEFMTLGCYEIKRQSFNWRVRRLVMHGFLLRHYLPALARPYTYSIGPLGVVRLQGMGEFYSGPPRGRGTNVDDLLCAHAVELNDLHLALARQSLVEEWIPEVEIRSKNELTNFGYAKDYDAIVTVRAGFRYLQFALEYERSAKKPREYFKIQEEIEGETHLDRFLYLVANEHLQSFLLQFFSKTRRRLYIGLAHNFMTNFLDMPVIHAATGSRTTLTETL